MTERIHTDAELVEILKDMGGRRRGLITAKEQLALREAAKVFAEIGRMRERSKASGFDEAEITASAAEFLLVTEEPKRPWLDQKP